MSYSSEQSNPGQHNSVDPNLSKKIFYLLSRRDQCDLVGLEYIAQQADPVGPRGVTVNEMMSVMDLSNPATSTRLRRMSDMEYGRIDTPLLKRDKFAGSQGADIYFLAEGVTSADIEKIMAMKGYSSESYHAKRQKKKQSYSDNQRESDAGGSDQLDTQPPENEENQQQSHFEPNLTYEPDTKEMDDSDCDNEDVEGIEVVIIRLIQEMAELKQDSTVIQQENDLLKEEIANLNSRLTKLEQKLLTGSYNKLVARLDQVFAPNQT